MPKGELFIKRTSAVTIGSTDTEAKRALYSYNNGVFTQSDSGEWIDVYMRYGVSFTESALSALMTPAPNKKLVENKSALQNGKKVITDTQYVKKDERDVSIEMHITAPSKAVFWQRYDLFCTEQLDYGYIEIINAHVPTKVLRMVYLNCSQFSEFVERLARFTLRLCEPDPTNRGVTSNN